MMTQDDKNEEKRGTQIYTCHLCDYKCSRKDNFERHKMTPKHQKMTKDDKNEFFEEFECVNCEKKYKYRQGLSSHKKKCMMMMADKSLCITTNNSVSNISPELIIEIIKQNQEFKTLLVQQNKSIMELSKNTTTTNNNNTNNTINSHNKTFNLQIFLNDTCKNAMNLTDFVSSLQIDLTDLERVGELGFVNGISKLIINGLNDLEECERPVHCSDLKRESMYVKDDNKWEKEDAENTKMKKALKQIAHKNIKMLPIWKAKNPDCKKTESHLSDKYSHMVIEAMGGSGDNDDEKANKIIRKIAKEVTIKKQF